MKLGSPLVGANRPDVVATVARVIPNVGPGERRIDHLVSSDIHPDMVDGRRIGGVGGEERLDGGPGELGG